MNTVFLKKSCFHAFREKQSLTDNNIVIDRGGVRVSDQGVDATLFSRGRAGRPLPLFLVVENDRHHQSLATYPCVSCVCRHRMARGLKRSLCPRFGLVPRPIWIRCLFCCWETNLVVSRILASLRQCPCCCLSRRLSRPVRAQRASPTRRFVGPRSTCVPTRAVAVCPALRPPRSRWPASSGKIQNHAGKAISFIYLDLTRDAPNDQIHMIQVRQQLFSC